MNIDILKIDENMILLFIVSLVNYLFNMEEIVFKASYNEFKLITHVGMLNWSLRT